MRGVINWPRSGVIEMRARLQKYFPIFLIALLVQVLAPIGACWAAAVAASDPLSIAEICHAGGAEQPTDQGGQQSEHGSGCSICCLAGASASIDTPILVAFAAPYREMAAVAWQEQTPDLSALRVRANARARAPPFSS
ncbi:DUF2946 family protein [Bradyrhizobium sp. Tv2a-2]|uniref:DUF2946 family protein n=1 Tax=Bradyrhizobium sp. Tv2a-2 TaxID=113395 RepID=UPI001FDA9585|nr:DUF2946 family protein [Bradyrhizobium sp. Tv2a-2]